MQNPEEIPEVMKEYFEMLEKRGIKTEELIPEPNVKITPQLNGQDVYYELYQQYTPEMIELLDGKLLGGGRSLTLLFQLILFNIGVEEAVKYAPKDVWLEALK